MNLASGSICFELNKTWFRFKIIKLVDVLLEVSLVVVSKSYCGTHLVTREISGNQCIKDKYALTFLLCRE